MGSLRRKLIIGFSAAALTGACAVTITYAWFARNNVAWVDEFDYNIKSSQGLLISTDGTNFKQDVPTSEIKSIIENWSGKNYEDVNYYMASLGSYESGDFAINPETLYPMIYTDTTKALAEEDYIGDIEYEHLSVEASKSDYLSFDLWLRFMDTGNTGVNTNLWFSNDTSINSKSEKNSATISNNLVTKEKTYVSGDTVEVTPSDAMRLFVSIKDDSMAEAKSFLYEPSIGLGSSALEYDDYTNVDDNYNKNKNAMYTYYNNLQPKKAFTKAATPGSAYLNTISSFTENEFYTFKYDESYTNEGSNLHYRDLHLVVTLYMEGWDADYFLGISSEASPYEASSFKVNLSFTVNDPNKEDED